MRHSVRLAVFTVAVVCLLACVPTASADSVSYQLTTPESSILGPSGTLFATVTVSLGAPGGSVSVSVVAGPGFGLFGNGGMFGLNVLDGTDGLSTSMANIAQSQPLGVKTMDGFGSFNVVVDGPPTSSFVTAFSFTISRTGGFTSLNQISGFAAHITGVDANENNINGMTGFAGGGGVVPEPGTLALLGSGLLAVGGFMRRKLTGSV